MGGRRAGVGAGVWVLGVSQRIVIRVARLPVPTGPKLQRELAVVADAEDVEFVGPRGHESRLAGEIAALRIPARRVRQPLRAVPELVLILRVRGELPDDVDAARGVVDNLGCGREVAAENFPVGVELAVP